MTHSACFFICWYHFWIDICNHRKDMCRWKVIRSSKKKIIILSAGVSTRRRRRRRRYDENFVSATSGPLLHFFLANFASLWSTNHITTYHNEFFFLLWSNWNKDAPYAVWCRDFRVVSRRDKWIFVWSHQ